MKIEDNQQFICGLIFLAVVIGGALLLGLGPALFEYVFGGIISTGR
ncbi:MAG: hypothetical protein PF961_10750 [Planctomycetota bacterium]|jgi:hypothetical protein|nr:hypothetical protein [Planctomycetota bacterium]